MSQRTLIVAFAALCVLALALFVVRLVTRQTLGNVTRADSTDASSVATGRRLYVTRCAGCHGASLEGAADWPTPLANGIPPASPLNSRGIIWQHDDTWIFRTIKHGGQTMVPPGVTNPMPAFGNSLTDSEIWAVIAYIKSTWPPETQAAQPTIVAP